MYSNVPHSTFPSPSPLRFSQTQLQELDRQRFMLQDLLHGRLVPIPTPLVPPPPSSMPPPLHTTATTTTWVPHNPPVKKMVTLHTPSTSTPVCSFAHVEHGAPQPSNTQCLTNPMVSIPPPKPPLLAPVSHGGGCPPLATSGPLFGPRAPYPVSCAAPSAGPHVSAAHAMVSMGGWAAFPDCDHLDSMLSIDCDALFCDDEWAAALQQCVSP